MATRRGRSLSAPRPAIRPRQLHKLAHASLTGTPSSRIEERASENRRFLEALVAGEGRTAEQGLMALAEHVAQRERADAEWGLLVIEFRVHAARSPELNRRYGSVHERTIAGVAGIVATIYEHADETPPLPPAELARLLLTVSAGARLEHATNADVLPIAVVAELLAAASSPLGAASPIGRPKRTRVA